MPDYPQRSQFEDAIARAVEPHAAQIQAEVESGDPVNWSGVATGIEQGVSDELLRVFVAVYLFMMDEPLDQSGSVAARSWAQATARQLASGFVLNSKASLDAGQSLASVVGTGRLTAIAATETTKAITAAETTARRIAAARADASLEGSRDRPEPIGPLDIGDGMEAIWWTEPDACEVCRALNGKPYSVWVTIFPAGPPSPHPHCRCWLVYKRLR